MEKVDKKWVQNILDTIESNPKYSNDWKYMFSKLESIAQTLDAKAAKTIQNVDFIFDFDYNDIPEYLEKLSDDRRAKYALNTLFVYTFVAALFIEIKNSKIAETRRLHLNMSEWTDTYPSICFYADDDSYSKIWLSFNDNNIDPNKNIYAYDKYMDIHVFIDSNTSHSPEEYELREITLDDFYKLVD